MTTRDDCPAFDAGDSLASLRQLSTLPDGVVYLGGNSLGIHPRAAMEYTAEVVVAGWGEGLVRSWNNADQRDLLECLGNKLAPPIGIYAGEMMIIDITSTNLLKVFGTILQIQEEGASRRKVTIFESSNSPIGLCIAEGLTDMLQRDYRLHLTDGSEQLPAATDADVAMMVLNYVNYRTGYLRDMHKVIRSTRENDVLTIWDLAHSISALPLDLYAAKADYTVGCIYKYLNGGPGSPACVWVAPHLHERVWQSLSGRFGHSRQFIMEPHYQPSEGVTRFLCDAQSITPLTLVECSLGIFARAGVRRLCGKSLALTNLFTELVENRCGHFGLALVTPCEHARRGNHVGFEHVQGYAIIQAPIDRGVIDDYHEPGILRPGSTPLYTRFVEVWGTVQVLLEILQSRTWKEPRYQVRHKVT